MQNNADEASTGRKGLLNWFSGNIRRKLTLFVVIILFMSLGLFWFFSVYMLQPAYQNSIRSGLTSAAYTVTEIINSMQAEGKPIVGIALIDASETQTIVGPLITQEFADRLNAAVDAGTLNLSNRCLDIASTNLAAILVEDNIEPWCALHPHGEEIFTTEGRHVRIEYNSQAAIFYRNQVFENGYIDVQDNNQISIGLISQNADYSVIVSATLERIPQAIEVIKRLLMPLAFIIAFFAVIAVWVFSHWFTRPIRKLSVATRELAKGNYDVRVANLDDDEIGDLARDFNTMAEEVGRSAEMQRDILANVSHDLRTPLTLIKGYAETVRDLTGEDAEKRTDQLNVIVDESDRLSALVGSVMELSRMSSGTEKPELVRFDLCELCDEIALRYGEVCRQDGLNFVFEGDANCNIYADANLIERALHNICGNAINHVGQDGYVGLKVIKTGYGMVRCEVSDHGPGINEEDKPHVFDRYYRSRANAGKPGTGLGLAITKAIFDAHGFDFGVNSKPGQGATFWFEARLA